MNAEKKFFISCFNYYIKEYVVKANNKVLMKAEKDGTVYFEFTEDGITTIRRFRQDEDMLFGYTFALDALYEYSKKTSGVDTSADSVYDKTVVTEKLHVRDIGRDTNKHLAEIWIEKI